MTVKIQPMPGCIRDLPPWLRPMTPPVFPDEPPTNDDRALARELFQALDQESQEWYRANHSTLFRGI